MFAVLVSNVDLLLPCVTLTLTTMTALLDDLSVHMLTAPNLVFLVVRSLKMAIKLFIGNHFSLCYSARQCFPDLFDLSVPLCRL
jgi:hypothetical protein